MRGALYIAIKNGIKVLRLKPFDTSSTDGRNHERHRRIAWSALTGIISQIVNYTVLAITVPLLLRILGVERYGLWLAISATESFSTFSDLGMGNGLVNLLSRAHGLENKKLARSYVSSIFAVIVTMALLIILIGVVLTTKIDWSSFFQIQDAETAMLAKSAVATYFTFFILNLIFGISSKVRMAYQEMYINNLLMAVAKIVMLIGIALGAWLNLSFIYFIAILAGAKTVSLVLNTIFLFGISHKWLRPSFTEINISAFKELFRTGGFFFVSGIANVLSVQIDSLVIGKYLGAVLVPVFMIPLQLFMLSRKLLSFVMMPLWPAYREAIVRNDVYWVRKTFWRTIYLTFLVNTGPMLILLFFAPQIIRLWTGQNLQIPQLLLWALAVNTLMVCLNGPMAMLLNGANILGIRALFSIIGALVNLVISIYLVGQIGISGPIWGTVISQLFISWPVSFYYIRRILRGSCSQGRMQGIS